MLLFCTLAFNPKINWDACSGLVTCIVAAAVVLTPTICTSPLGDVVLRPIDSETLNPAPTKEFASNVPEVFTFELLFSVVAVSALPVTSPICWP